MINPALRRYLLNQLMSGIQTIGPEFEAFGTRVVDCLVDEQMLHKGLNPEGHPVGHAVDSVSTNGTITAEYSAEEGYFKAPFAKLFKDLRHSRTLHNQVTRVLLLSNKECGPKAHTQLINLAARLKRWMGLDLEIYDSRRLAEYIVDNILLDDRALDALSPYLVTLDRVRAEFVATNLIPNLAPGYLNQPDEAELRERVMKTRVGVLSGMSGSGKSETVVAVATAIREQFEMVLWIPAGEIREVTDLKAVSVERRGHRLNVLHLLRDRSSLVILDNLSAHFTSEDLQQYCGEKSAILVTRQLALEGDVRKQLLNVKDARSLLEQGLSKCPDHVFDLVWKTVGGHPLALRLMNSGVRNSSWTDLQEDCAAIGEYLDEDGLQRLADRLLQRLQPVVERELALFLWCKSSRIDRLYARRVLKPIGVRKLDETCLLAADRNDVLRLHDIVYSAAKSLQISIGKYSEEFDKALDAHIENVALATGSDLSFLNFIDVHGELLKSLIEQCPGRSALAYCLAHSSADKDIDASLLCDPSSHSRELMSRQDIGDIDVSAICETIEAIYRKVKYDSGVDAAREQLEKNLVVFEELANHAGISKHSYRTVLHHQAKALRNLKRFDEAISLCERILSDFAHPATKLLLARLLLSTKDKTAIERSKNLLFELLAESQTSAQGADISVTLAAIETLGWSDLKSSFPQALDRFGDLVAECIIESANRMLDHAFVAFASIGRFLQYNSPEKFHSIFMELPKRIPEDARDDKECSAWAEILMSASKSDLCPEEEREAIRMEALKFFERLEKPSDFNLQEKAQLLFLLNRYSDAINVLQPLVENNANPWNRYWLSKSLFAQGDSFHDLPEALQLIDAALEDQRANTFRASFLEHRWEIRKAFGDPCAIDDLQAAHDCCANEKYKAALIAKLEKERS